MKIYEYRGIENLVYAKILTDTTEGFTTDEVKPLAGISELTRATESSSEAHYYDNMPAVVVEATGSDEVTATVSAIPLDILADITGQYYDTALGMFVEGQRDSNYYALGYKTKTTDGDEVYVWRLKGTFSIPDSTHNTEDDGTDANGQEITYTGVSTVHKFTKTKKGAKAVMVNASEGTADVSKFFDTVQTPDTIKAGTKASTASTTSSTKATA